MRTIGTIAIVMFAGLGVLWSLLLLCLAVPRPDGTTSEVDPPMRRPLERDPRFTAVNVWQYDWNQSYSAVEYRQLMLSYSGTQTMEPVARAGLLDDIEAFVNQQFNGAVTRPAVVTLTTATRIK